MNPLHFFDGMHESDCLYLGVILLAGVGLLWLALLVRRLKKAVKIKDYDLERLIEFRDKAFENARQAANTLAEKDRVIESVLKESNQQRATDCFLIRQMKKEIEGLVKETQDCQIIMQAGIARVAILEEILMRTVPYSRLQLRGDPAKLSAWLERLKGKKAGRKPKIGIDLAPGPAITGYANVWNGKVTPISKEEFDKQTTNKR